MDSVAVKRSDLIFSFWLQKLRGNCPEGLVGNLASRHCPGTPATARRLKNGAFNVCYRISFTDGSRVIVRLAALGRTVARTEKVSLSEKSQKYCHTDHVNSLIRSRTRFQ